MKTNDRLAQSIGMNFISQFANVLANKSTASTFNNITLKDITQVDDTMYHIVIEIPRIDDAKITFKIDENIVKTINNKNLSKSFYNGCDDVNAQISLTMKNRIDVFIKCEDEDSDATIEKVTSTFMDGSTVYDFLITSSNINGISTHVFKDEKNKKLIEPALISGFNKKYAKFISKEGLSKIKLKSWDNAAFNLSDQERTTIHKMLDLPAWKNNLNVLETLEQQIIKAKGITVHKELGTDRGEHTGDTVSVLQIAQNLYEIYQEYDRKTLLNLVTEFSKVKTIRNNDVRRALQQLFPNFINELDAKVIEFGKPIELYTSSIKNAKIDELQEIHEQAMQNLAEKASYMIDRLKASYRFLTILSK